MRYYDNATLHLNNGEKVMENTAERLNQIMAEQNLRQTDIIERAKPICAKFGGKLTRQDISQYVNGKVVPKQDKLFILAAALNVSEPWLMGYDVPRDRTLSVDVSEINNESRKKRLAAYLEKLTDGELEVIQSIADLSEDVRDSILHQIEYEREKEIKRRLQGA